MDTVRDVAMKLFAKHDVKLDCYKNDERNWALKDMLEVYPDGVDGFTASEIALELQKIGDEVPDPPHPEWRVVWDTDSCTDGYDLPVGTSEKAAYQSTINQYDAFVESFVMDYGDLDPDSQEFKDEWNYMIYNCYATLWHYDPEFVAQQSDHDLDKYYGTDCRDGWYRYTWVSDEDLEKIGWKEI